MNTNENQTEQHPWNATLQLSHLQSQAETVAHKLVQLAALRPGHIVVIGCSTSEVIGSPIGTLGTMDIAHAIYTGLHILRSTYGLELAIQCCEHLNRALVVERHTMERFQLEEVVAVPVQQAGGAMAAHAYRHFPSACLVANIQADAGIDIGETLIGMHLRRVAVPLRPDVRYIGQARVNMARTRPQLIGGNRAVYPFAEENSTSSCK